MEQQLTDYIIKKYNPVAVFIHGSRSNIYARELSDWDFAIVVDTQIEGEREIVDGANIEVRVLQLPFDEENITDKWFALREGNVKVIYDPKTIAPNIVEKVTAKYAQPLLWTPSEILGHKAWYRSHIDGMIDYQNEQEMFFRKLGEIYTRSIQYWFHFLHYTYMPQVYLSLPKIKNNDPEYFALVQILASTVSNKEKIDAAEKIYRRIWK